MNLAYEATLADQGTFFLSCFDERSHTLHGYAFEGVDLILGDAGYKKYRSERRALISSGQDGSYIIVSLNESETVIGTDFSGYHKLFLYRHRHVWAVSNSIIALIQFAREKHLPVTVDEAHLFSFFIKGSFGNQLASLKTAVQEIELVPSTSEIAISEHPIAGSEVTIRRTEAVQRIDNTQLTYRESLGAAVRTWVGRMATLICGDVDIVCELTGGRDSRAVLALLLRASLAASSSMTSASFRSYAGGGDDLRIAADIAGKYSLRLNDNSSIKYPAASLSGEQRYRRWKDLNLGVYTPIYFPNLDKNPQRILLGGAGGESHRQFYQFPSLEYLLDHRKKYFPTNQHFQRFSDDVLDSMNALRVGYESDLDPLIIHYRHFRDRLHGGRTPQYTYQVLPLAGSLFRAASVMCPPDLREEGQVLVDILCNCSRDLAMQPYDRPNKLPSEWQISNISSVSEFMHDIDVHGKIFFHNEEARIVKDPSSEFDLLERDINSSLEILKNSGIFRKDYIENAINNASIAKNKKRIFPHPVDGSPISHIIYAAELLRSK